MDRRRVGGEPEAVRGRVGCFNCGSDKHTAKTCPEPLFCTLCKNPVWPPRPFPPLQSKISAENRQIFKDGVYFYYGLFSQIGARRCARR